MYVYYVDSFVDHPDRFYIWTGYRHNIVELDFLFEIRGKYLDTLSLYVNILVLSINHNDLINLEEKYEHREL